MDYNPYARRSLSGFDAPLTQELVKRAAGNKQLSVPPPVKRLRPSVVDHPWEIRESTRDGVTAYAQVCGDFCDGVVLLTDSAARTSDPLALGSAVIRPANRGVATGPEKAGWIQWKNISGESNIHNQAAS